MVETDYLKAYLHYLISAGGGAKELQSLEEAITKFRESYGIKYSGHLNFSRDHDGTFKLESCTGELSGIIRGVDKNEEGTDEGTLLHADQNGVLIKLKDRKYLIMYNTAQKNY